MTAHQLTREEQTRLKKLATYGAVAVAVTLICAKLVAWWLTDSVAVLSSLADSMLDAVASVVTLMAVRFAVEPADEQHRFGHGKAEALAGLGQAAFIAGSGCLLLIESVRRLIEPRPVRDELVGIGVMIFAIVLTLALVIGQRYVIRRTGSVAVSGDALHYEGDILINAAVIVSLGAHWMWGWQILDPIFAVAIVAYLVWNAWRIAGQSMNMLMDRELPEAERKRIKDLVMEHPEARDFHDLRSRQSGGDTFIQFHLELDPDMTLYDAHEIADEIELRIMAEFPNAEVIIHQDPAGLEEDHPIPAAE